MLLARSLRALGRTAEALDALRVPAAATLDGQLLRAELEAAVNGPAAADRIFEGLTAQPDSDAAWFLAWADLQRASEDRIRVLEAAAARFPDHALVQERLAVAAWARGDRVTAMHAAHRATAADTSRTGAWFVEIELASTAADRAATVIPLLDRFEAAFGPDSQARVGMAEMLAGLSRSADDPAAARALGWMDEALARHATDAPAAVARARLLVAQGRSDQALSALDALVAHNPEMPAALKLRAELLGASARYSESVSAYHRYLAVAPDDLTARRQQARVEGWRGAYEASRDKYARLREQQPGADVIAAESAAKQAYIQRAMGRGGGTLRPVAALDPNDVEAQLERAQLYDRLGRPQDAVEGFRAVSTSATPNDVAHSAAERIDCRRQTSVDLFATGNSADAAARQQLLDLMDSGAGVSDDLGLGYATRARLFGGPSFARGIEDRSVRQPRRRRDEHDTRLVVPCQRHPRISETRHHRRGVVWRCWRHVACGLAPANLRRHRAFPRPGEPVDADPGHHARHQHEPVWAERGGTFSLKSWLASGVLALAAFQLYSALWIYGRLPDANLVGSGLPTASRATRHRA